MRLVFLRHDIPGALPDRIKLGVINSARFTLLSDQGVDLGRAPSTARLRT
jgi:hypothetical protein